MKNIEDRLDNSLQIPEDIYSEGIMDVISFLCTELNQFLITERRFLGITKSYMNSINDSLSKMNSKITENDVLVYGRILYLYKPLIKREFKRLKNKKLSSGDSTIIIINKLIELASYDENNKIINSRFNKEIKTIRKIISKFYENIRNKRKDDPLFVLSNSVKTYMPKGLVGKYSLDSISLIDPINIKEELKNPGERINEDSNLKEIDF